MISLNKPFDKMFKATTLLLFLLLAGCVTRPPNSLIDPRDRLPLESLNHWQLKSRVAIKTPDDSVTASLDWQKNNRRFDFYLTGSFGVTIVHLIQEESQASLEIPDHDKLTGTDADLLLRQTLGWDFPLESLSYWVKGLPSGNPREVISRNAQNQITQITLDQWQIDFSKYQYFQGYKLPKMIKVQHPSLSLKVVAKKWLFLK